MKKILILLGVVFSLLIVGVVAVAAIWFLAPGKVRQFVEGETRLLDYLGSQVVGIANTYLVPELTYEAIRYDAPFTLTLDGVRLTAPDTTRVLDLGRMTVTLAERPRMNEPIRVASLELSNGAVNLIQDPENGGFRGLSPLVEPTERVEETTQDKPQFSLSNVLVLNKIVIGGIDLVYDAGDGSPPMRLDALRADLDIVPATDAGAGWYELKLASGRRPGLELDLDGRINIDSFDLVLDRVDAQALLDDQTATTLPPQLAALINQYQVRGAMEAVITGRVPLLDAARAEVDLEASLNRGNAVIGEYRVPIERLDLAAGMASGVVDLRSLSLKSLGGSLTATGRVGLDGDATVSWDVSQMDLREILASRPADQPPKLAGKVASTGSARTPVAAPMEGLSGAGQLSVTEGRLVNIPVFSDLMRVAQVAGLRSPSENRDSFQTPFTLSPTGVRLDGFDFRTPALAARGTGTIGFDGSLDLSANGGPLEAVQNRLGPLGGIIGKITDQFVTYRIRGTTAEPKVSVQPLGIGG